MRAAPCWARCWAPRRSRPISKARQAPAGAPGAGGGGVVGGVVGTSPVTAYIESASGAGGRTGLVAITVAILFLAALVFAPLAGAGPAYSTAPALIFVAALFVTDLKEVAWDDMT